MMGLSNRFDRHALLLYAVTDRAWLGGRTLSHDVEEALKGGVSMVQLREKNLPDSEFLAEAQEIKALCKKYGVPFIINDSVEVFLACDADGIHIGQSDMEALKVRERLGDDKIIGVSAQTVEQAILAEKSGADYLGVGAVFSTSTKKDADFVPYDTLKAICEAVSIPVVAIGGIYEHNIEKLNGSGICGVALVSAIFAVADIEKTSAKMLELSKKTACLSR
jgi:thiamine-phosphate pyrophosphorylase